MIEYINVYARMVELVDTLDLAEQSLVTANLSLSLETLRVDAPKTGKP